MIGVILGFTLTAFAVGGTGLVVASRRADGETRRARLLKFASYFVIVHALLMAAYLGRTVLTALLAAISAVGAWELRGAVATASPSLRRGSLGVYAMLAGGMIVFGARKTPEAAAYVYLIVATFDGFSQVTGQLFGRRPIASRISPGKTVAGVIGGMVGATVVAVWLRGLVDLTVADALVASGALVPAALAGDLAASWLKRKCGIKDFGLLLPGHGGVLDRFDSLLMAAPVSLLLH
jgi:phosphatidate cytidylyltransferase